MSDSSDERMREQIRNALMRARSLDTRNVTVLVSDARVVLEGSVPERRTKHAVGDLAAACPGVQDLENRLRVQRPTPSV
jgi:osmotically-inducible protein OsmY